jgi:hypothetical protein
MWFKRGITAKFERLTAKDAKSAKENTGTNHDGTTNTTNTTEENARTLIFANRR